MNTVLRGQADIGVDWLSSLLVARGRSDDLTNIAQMFQATGQRSLIVRFLRASIQRWQLAVAHPARAGMISYRHELPGNSTPSVVVHGEGHPQ